MGKKKLWWKKKKYNSRPKRNGRNYHHLKAKSRNGSNEVYNLLLIYTDKHEVWHKLFGLLTLEEVIKLLQRVSRAKEAQRRI